MADNVIEEGRSRIEDILLKKYEGQPLSRIEEILLDLYNDIVHLDPETGLIPVDKIPPQVFERMITVTDDTARFALTTDDVQNGDWVYVNSTQIMYFVSDDTNLDKEAGYTPVAAGIAAKAVGDKNGNVIDTTYAKNADLDALATRVGTNENNILKVQAEANLNKSALLGTNIFDKSTFIYDAERSSTTGEVMPNSAKYGVSEIIPVRSGKTLYFSRNGTALAPTFIYTWQKDGTFIGRTSGAATYSIPSNVGYISICIYYNDGRVNTYQAQYDKVTAYEEYERIYSNDIKQTADTFKLLASVNMFGSIAGIGDSYTAGLSANSGGSTQTMTEQSYIATMGKRSGVDWYNYGVSGATAKTYITNANGLPKVLAADAHDLYIVNIGQNDINVGSTVGTISDIHLADYTQNPDTYYGNMGSILSQLKAYAPNAKIILVKSWLNHNKSGTDISYQSLDSAIEAIAALYNIPCIAPFDDVFFNSTNYQNYRSLGHPTTMGYAMMGLAMERLLSKCIVANPSYFQFSTIG